MLGRIIKAVRRPVLLMFGDSHGRSIVLCGKKVRRPHQLPSNRKWRYVMTAHEQNESPVLWTSQVEDSGLLQASWLHQNSIIAARRRGAPDRQDPAASQSTVSASTFGLHTERSLQTYPFTLAVAVSLLGQLTFRSLMHPNRMLSISTNMSLSLPLAVPCST
jgi:hypothetical protein